MTTLAFQAEKPTEFWNDNSVIKTYLLDAISIILPEGERFITDAVTSALQNIPQLSLYTDDIKKLIKEEESHSVAHKKINAQLARKGYPVERLEQRIHKSVNRLMTLDPQEKLAIAAAFEFLTAMVSEVFLDSNRWITQKKSKPANLWRWHCTEEIEHQSTTYDMLKDSRCSYFLRVSIYFSASMILLSDIFVNMRALRRTDIANKKLSRLSYIKSAGIFFFKNGGDIVRLFWAWTRYFGKLK